MRKLALIGKNISHSRSPEMYRKLISKEIEYDLLDIESPEKIPSALELFKKYDGINITSPYKEHFLKEVVQSESVKKLGALNCLKIKDGVVYAENTDYLAIADILSKLKKSHSKLETIILGDGVMSRVFSIALTNLGLPFKIYSRKTVPNFDQIDLASLQDQGGATNLVINTCARAFVYKGNLQEQSIFLDSNYNFTEHQELFSKRSVYYIDGIDLLLRQAEYAVAFWSAN